MAQPTSISVATDNEEYSRYEPDKATVNATVHIAGGAAYSNELILVEMVKARRSRDAVVAATMLAFNGATDPQTQMASFHLPDIVDQDMINLVRHGKYFIRATSPAAGAVAVIGEASGAPIRLTTVGAGSAYNDYEAEVVIPPGTSELFVTVSGGMVTISLATINGVPVPAKNTREAVRAFIASNLVTDLVATFDGMPGLSLTQPEGPVPFSGGRDEISAESDDFAVRIVSVDRLKRDFLFGIPMTANEVRHVRFQPTNIKGVSITEISKGHALGVYPLTYNYIVDGLTNATAQIGLGSNGTVTIEAVRQNEGSRGNDFFVEVVVPSGTSPLGASLVDDVLTVSLSVVGGVPQAADNTAAQVADAINLVEGFAARASGTGADPLTGPEGPTAMAGGTDRISRTLSWDGGPVVSINSPGTYILRKGGTPQAGIRSLLMTSMDTDYIIVRVAGPAFLPTSHQVDELLVENMKIDDEALGRYLDQAVDWIENTALAIYLEPTVVVTDRDPTTIQYAAGINSPSPIFSDPDYDFIVGPLTYFVPRAGGDWVDIQTPFPQILRVDSLFGSIANTRVIDIDLDWIQAYPQGGLIQIVPFNQSVAFDYLGLIWVNALRGAQVIPNFWHFNMVVGLRDTPGELQELIAKKAAMDALVTLGTALRPGVGSVSLGRDGVSQSVSYTTQSQYGPYTGAVNAFKEWIDTNLVKFKGKYRGATMVVV